MGHSWADTRDNLLAGLMVLRWDYLMGPEKVAMAALKAAGMVVLKAILSVVGLVFETESEKAAD